MLTRLIAAAAVATLAAGLGSVASAEEYTTGPLACQFYKYRDVDPGARILTVLKVTNTGARTIPGVATFEVSFSTPLVGPKRATIAYNYESVPPGGHADLNNPFKAPTLAVSHTVPCQATAHWNVRAVPITTPRF